MESTSIGSLAIGGLTSFNCYCVVGLEINESVGETRSHKPLPDSTLVKLLCGAKSAKDSVVGMVRPASL